MTVDKADTSQATVQKLLPNDKTTVSSSFGTPGGTVDFSLYGPNNATCDPSGAAPVYSELGVALDGNGEAKTSNNGTYVNDEGTYRWLTEYSGDATHNPSTSECGVEQFTIDNHAAPATPDFGAHTA